MTTFGYGRRRSKPSPAALHVPAWAARMIVRAGGPGTAERPIEPMDEAVAVRRGPIQLAAFDAAEEES